MKLHTYFGISTLLLTSLSLWACGGTDEDRPPDTKIPSTPDDDDPDGLGGAGPGGKGEGPKVDGNEVDLPACEDTPNAKQTLDNEPEEGCWDLTQCKGTKNLHFFHQCIQYPEFSPFFIQRFTFDTSQIKNFDETRPRPAL